MERFTQEISFVNIPKTNGMELRLYWMNIEEEDIISHTHSTYEIYVNLSGSVSFVVNDVVYPLQPGSIIVSRPFEYHHIIYHNNTTHKCILMYPYIQPNDELFESLFDKLRTYSLLSNESFYEINKICNRLKDSRQTSLQSLKAFLDLLTILTADVEQGESEHLNYSQISKDVALAIDYISQNIKSPITVKQLAEYSHVSVNTLERHFKASMGMSPSTYVTRSRLSKAALLLQQNQSVTYAAFESGFSDSSHFSFLFKSYYNLTPRQYQKCFTKKPKIKQLNKKTQKTL